MEQNPEQEQLALDDAQKIWDEEANKSAEDNSPEMYAEPEQKEEQPLETESKEEVEAVAEPETQEQPLEAEKTETETKEVEDPFAGLPDAVKAKLAKIDDIEKANANLLHHVKTAEGRVAAMQRELEVGRRVKQELEKNDSPTQKQIKSAGKNPEKWENLKQDFPDWATAIEEYVEAKSVSQAQPTGIDEKTLSGYIANQTQALRQDLEKDIERSKIENRHADWQATVASSEFQTWYNNQPNEVRSLGASFKAKDAIKVLDMYESTKKKPVDEIKQTRTAKLAQAASPDKRNQTPPPKSLDDMTPEEVWNYDARKLEKTREQRGF